MLVLNAVCLLIETGLNMACLIGAIEVFVQSSSYFSVHLYLSLFYLSLESHIENIEKHTSKLHWIFYNTAVVSFIFTPFPRECFFYFLPWLQRHHLIWILPLLQIVVKFYGLVWFGRDRLERLLTSIGLQLTAAPKWKGLGGSQDPLQSSSPLAASPEITNRDADRFHGMEPKASTHNVSNAWKKRNGRLYFAVLVTHVCLWSNLVGQLCIFHPYLVIKVIAIMIALNPSSPIYHRMLSGPRTMLRKYSLSSSLCALTLIDCTILFLFAKHNMMGSAEYSDYVGIKADVSMFISSALQTMTFLPMNFLLYSYVRRPKQLSFAEYTKMLWKCQGIIPYKTMKMKKLHYYVSTSQAMITKEFPTGVTATMITVPFSSGAMRDAFYIFLQPSNTLYQIEELHHLFYRQEEASNDMVIGKLYNANTKKAMMALRDQHEGNKGAGINGHNREGEKDKMKEKDKERDNKDRDRDRHGNNNFLGEQMFNDLYMHCKAQEFAVCYNQHEHSPPKSVEFVQAAIFEYTDYHNNSADGMNGGSSSAGNGSSKLLWIEERIDGEYDKYSNNAGWVNNTRLSPHAFSHFTYHHSKHKLVVVDMQGAENRYTDPQIHSIVTLMTSVWQFFGLEKKEEFGCGNLGKRGIELWKETHRCSDLCKALGLPEILHQRKSKVEPTNAKGGDERDRLGNHPHANNGNHLNPQRLPIKPGSGGNMYVGSTMMALKQYKGVRYR